MNKIIAVVGANGKMGSLVCEKLSTDYQIIKITEENKLSNISSSDCKNIRLVIDFANANSSVKSTKFCVNHKIPILIASTGQTQKQIKEILSNSNTIPIMICPNLSLGICLVKKMINSIIKKNNYEINIHEKHHNRKKDKPSGTALLLSNYIKTLNNKQIKNITAERGGKEIGTHSISFYFGDELITISHQAFSREAFAEGAVIAINYLLQQKEPKQYFFDDIFNEK